METASTRAALHARLVDAIGADAVKSSVEDLAVYAYDGYSESRSPDIAVLPRDAGTVFVLGRKHRRPTFAPA